MATRAKIELLLAGIVVLVLGLGLREWIAEREARVRAETVQQTQKQLQAEYQKQVEDLTKQMADRDAAYRASSQALGKQFQTATTPQQVADLISTAMGLRQPIVISQPAPTAANPQPQAVAQIPSIDFPQAKSYLQDCEQCKLDRTKLTADAADRAAQAVLAQKEIDSLKTERDSWKQAAKGGTLFQRVKKAAKYIAIGAGVGAVALCASGHCK